MKIEHSKEANKIREINNKLSGIEQRFRVPSFLKKLKKKPISKDIDITPITNDVKNTLATINNLSKSDIRTKISDVILFCAFELTKASFKVRYIGKHVPENIHKCIKENKFSVSYRDDGIDVKIPQPNFEIKNRIKNLNNALPKSFIFSKAERTLLENCLCELQLFKFKIMTVNSKISKLNSCEFTTSKTDKMHYSIWLLEKEIRNILENRSLYGIIRNYVYYKTLVDNINTDIIEIQKSVDAALLEQEDSDIQTILDNETIVVKTSTMEDTVTNFENEVADLVKEFEEFIEKETIKITPGEKC